MAQRGRPAKSAAEVVREHKFRCSKCRRIVPSSSVHKPKASKVKMVVEGDCGRCGHVRLLYAGGPGSV